MNSKTSTRTPRQQRAIDTYENLLTATGELLMEVGLERISTNMIAERADVSPPALYRYFKDKYDILSALGQRLMDAQNELVVEINDKLQSDPDFVLTKDHIAKLLMETVDVTEKFAGGAWIMKCLRVVPSLRHIRTESHDEMSRAMTRAALTFLPDLDEAEIYRQTRLTIEFGYAAIELVLEDPSLDREAVLKDTAAANAAFHDVLR